MATAHPTHLSDLAARGLVTRAAAGSAAAERTLPLLPAFAALLPAPVVQRGSVVGCAGGAAVSLALSLAAGPSQQGAWVAVVGMPALGLAAAVEAGIVLERLVAVTEPADDARWADVLAACIDGFDVVLLGPSAQQVHPSTARRLTARLQSRGAVAIAVGAPVFGADLRFECTASTWEGLGDGHGVARGRRTTVELTGRRVPRARRAEYWLPAADGRMNLVDEVAHVQLGTAPSGHGAVLPLRRTG
jgi:hypothetical protein